MHVDITANLKSYRLYIWIDIHKVCLLGLWEHRKPATLCISWSAIMYKWQPAKLSSRLINPLHSITDLENNKCRITHSLIILAVKPEYSHEARLSLSFLKLYNNTVVEHRHIYCTLVLPLCKSMTHIVTWRPTQGARSKGCPKKTHADLLEDDTGYAVNEVENSMKDRRLWRAIIDARQQKLTEWVSEWWPTSLSSCKCNQLKI